MIKLFFIIALVFPSIGHANCGVSSLEEAKEVVVSNYDYDDRIQAKLSSQIKLYCLNILFSNDIKKHSDIVFYESELSEYISYSHKIRVRKANRKLPQWKRVKRWVHFPPKIWIESDRKKYYLAKFKLHIEFISKDEYLVKNEI